MIENLIKQMRENSLRPKEEVSIKDLFKTICKSFALNKEILNQSLIEESGQELDMASIQNIFTRQSLNKYGNVNAPFINNYGRVSENMVPYGIVGVMIERKIRMKNHLEIIKTCLETHNSLIIKPFFQSQTLTLFVTIINDVLKQTVDFNEIVLTDANLEKENIDLLIYIGDKTYFKKIDFKGEKIFLGIGQYELFVDEIIDEKMIEFARNNGVKIFYGKDKSFDELNQNGANYCSAIMSSNKERIREFISSVKSSYVLVNMSPTLVDNSNLFPEQLLKRKTTIIYQ